MTRKEKLNQAKRLADLWYKQQKVNYTLRNKKSAGDCMMKKRLRRQANSRIQNYTRKIVTQKRGFVNES